MPSPGLSAPAMDGSYWFSSVWLLLILETGVCYPVLSRARRDYPLSLEALAEIPVEHFGLVDDYGELPKHPSLRQPVAHKQPEGLAKAGKSKRDEPDIDELYYDDFM